MLRDFSGKPKSINKELLNLLINSDYVPVLTVPIIDENGIAINSENDDIVALLQKEFQAERVIHLIEAPGFMRDPEDETSLISGLSFEELSDWESGAQGRIKRKLLAIKKLFDTGVLEVFIADGRSSITQPVTDALNGKGTTIK